MNNRSRFVAGAWVSALALLLSCGGSDHIAPRVPAGIVVVPNSPMVGQGLTLQLTGTVVDANGREIKSRHPVFSSEDPGIATVTASGLVTSTGPLGTARITADLDGLTTFVDVSVVQRIVGIKVVPESLVLNRTYSAGLSYAMLDYAGNPAFPPGIQFLFSSNNQSVATVTSFGYVTATTQAGNAVITVQADTFSVDVPVHVVAIPATITVNPSSVLLQPGGSQSLSVQVLDSAGLAIVGAPVGFQVSGGGVVSVSPAGVVTSLGPAGSGTITITSGTLQQVIGYFVGNVPAGTFTTVSLSGPAYAAAVNGAGDVVVTTLDGKVHHGTLATRTFPSSVPVGDLPLGLSLSPDGQTAWVAVGNDQKVRPVDLATTTAGTASPLLVGGTAFSTAASPDGQYVYAGTNNYLYRLAAADLSIVDSVQVSVALHLAHHPTQPLVYASENIAGQVVEVNTTTMTRERTFPVGSSAQGVALSPDGALLYAVSEGAGVLKVFDLTTGDSVNAAALVGGGFGLAVSDNLIVVTESISQTVQLFDRVSLVKLLTKQINGSPRRPAISGNTIIIPDDAQGAVIFID